MDREIQLDIDPIIKWFPDFKKPMIISGPCSAENENQIMKTATALSGSGKVDIFRAGIWKPRTRPNSFEGVGEVGLKWLNSVKQKTGLPVATEVANSRHVELCLKYNVDFLWTGARTAANPFSIQDIADALKGVDIPVMIKNPVNADLDLWIGALERIHNAGIVKLMAVHRGFSSFKKTGYRNDPNWLIPIELRTLCPDLYIICDPSHIAGNKELIPLISQKALDMDMAGLMIESHIQPERALSDVNQQLTPKGLIQMLDGLIIRESSVRDVEFNLKLDQLRGAIDELDDSIIHTLASRMEISEKIGLCKLEKNVTIFQARRWDEIIKNRIDAGENMGLRRKFLIRLLRLIHQESIGIQTNVMSNKKDDR